MLFVVERFTWIAVKEDTKKKIDKIVEERVMKKYEVVDQALKQYNGRYTIELDEEVYAQIKRLKKTFKLKSESEAIKKLLLALSVFFDDNLRFWEALKPIPELVELLKKKNI